jgi:aminoglycoside 6'-N-acetyltransferase I
MYLYALEAIMNIIDLTSAHHKLIEEVAQIVVDGFEGNSWPDLRSAYTEIEESFADGRISRVAIDERGHALGWISGIEQYDGHVWELHPLVVKPARQRQGIGSALVVDLESCVKARGGSTIILGTDDITNATSLSGVNLYPDVTEHIRSIVNLKHHPYEFYQKLGYVIVGVVPDANGWGKPDILMAKPC